MDAWTWFTLVGLAGDIVGAGYLAAGLFISKEEAVRLSVSRLSGDTLQENLRLPAVQDRLKQSRRAKVGVAFLIVGFLLQGVGSLLSAS